MPGTDEQAFYDDIWLAWRDMQRYAPAPRYLRRMVMKELRALSFGSVLDVGCGEGTLLSMIAARYPAARLGGCEFSATALQSCRELLPGADLFSLDLLKDDVAGIAYDVLLSVQVLEHLSDDIVALERMRSMCMGTLIVSVPGGQLDDRGRRNGHYRHYTRRDLVQKMERTGFRVTRSFTCGWPVHSLFYRQLLRALPQDAVEKVGLGGYDRRKRTIMRLADWAYRLNLSFIGTEVFAVGVPV